MGQIKIEPPSNPILPIILVMVFLGVMFLLLQFGFKYMRALWYNRDPPSKKHRHHHHKKKKSRKDSSSEESSDSSSE